MWLAKHALPADSVGLSCNGAVVPDCLVGRSRAAQAVTHVERHEAIHCASIKERRSAVESIRGLRRAAISYLNSMLGIFFETSTWAQSCRLPRSATRLADES